MREEAARYDDIRSNSDGCCDGMRETVQDSNRSHASRCAEQQKVRWTALTSADYLTDSGGSVDGWEWIRMDLAVMSEARYLPMSKVSYGTVVNQL